MTTNKTDQVVRALRKGYQTAKALRQKSGLASVNAVYATISKLRSEGYRIVKVPAHRAGTFKYTLAA